jgi:hypothetical protein
MVYRTTSYLLFFHYLIYGCIDVFILGSKKEITKTYEIDYL